MHVLLVGLDWVARWSESCQRALEELGHNVTLFHPNWYLLDRVRYRLERTTAGPLPGLSRLIARLHGATDGWFGSRLVAAAARTRPDLTIVLKGSQLHADALEAAKRHLNGPLVSWWLDNPLAVPHVVETLLLYDHFFIFDKSYISRLSEFVLGGVTHLPCAADPNIYHPLALTPHERRIYRADVCFVGLYEERRRAAVEALAGWDIAVWSSAWQGGPIKGMRLASRRYVPPQQVARVYAGARIVLNVHQSQTRLGGLNMRTFEALSCGAFELTDYVPGIEELLEPGREIACYADLEELKERVRYYLDAGRDEERRAIARRGRERVWREHTYLHRMQTILQTLGMA